MPFELFSFREAYKSEAQFPKSSVRNCPKSLGRTYNVALRATQTVLFGSFWPPYTLQIYGVPQARSASERLAPQGCPPCDVTRVCSLRAGVAPLRLCAGMPSARPATPQSECPSL